MALTQNQSALQAEDSKRSNAATCPVDRCRDILDIHQDDREGTEDQGRESCIRGDLAGVSVMLQEQLSVFGQLTQFQLADES